MSLRRAHLVFAASLALTAACDDSVVDPRRGRDLDAQDSAALFQTDSTTYTFVTTDIGTHGRIRATLTNRSGRTMYFLNCNGGTSISIQRLEASQWSSFWSPVLLACLSAPIIVPSGGTYTFDFHVFGGKSGSNYYPQFDGPLKAALYRVLWHDAYFTYQDRLPWGEAVPESQRVSNSFTIRAP